MIELRGVDEVDGSVELEVDFRPATRLAVEGGIAVTCIGGRLTGLAFLGSVDDSVYETVRRVLVSIRVAYLSALPPHEDRNTAFTSFLLLLFQL